MSLLKCDKCGEMYSDSYRSCPFCEEDEAYYSGGRKAAKRQRLAREGKRNTPGIIGPALILVAVMIVALLVWALFGDSIRQAITGDDGSTPPAQLDTMPNEPDDTAPTPTVELTMDGTMLLALDESKQLEITGGTSYEWISSNPAVATVSDSGMVKAVTEGTTTITATDVSGEVAVCSVTVTKEGAVTPEPVTPVTPNNGGTTNTDKPEGPTKPTVTTVDVKKLVVKVPIYGSTLQLSSAGYYDLSLTKSETEVRLVIEGTDVVPKWTSDNANKVSVSSDGTLKWVSSGETHVWADLNGVKLDFLIRAH